MKTKYTIKFLYTDNDQLYQTDVELEAEEVGQLSKFLTRLERAGEIKREGGCNPMIYAYHAPTFLSFEDLKANWGAGGLTATANRHGIQL